jgi:Tol biopolymer transport system component
MLIATRFADVSEIHRVTMPGGARSQLTFYPDAVSSAQYEPTQGNYFVFSKDVGGGEFYQLYRDDLDTGDITLLTDGKSRNTGAVWWEAGGKLAYGSTRRTGKDVDLWVINPEEPRSDHLVAKLDGGGWDALDWSPDGRKILTLEEVSANESYLWVVDSDSGEKTLLTPKGGEKVSYAGGRFSKDGKGVYSTTDKDSELHRLAYMDLSNREHTYLTSAIPWDVEEFDLSDDGQRIAFVSNEDGFGVLHIYDVTGKSEKPVTNLPRGLVEQVHWRRHSRELGFNLDSPRSPADVYSLDT